MITFDIFWIYFFFDIKERTNRPCAWWQASCLPITVPLSYTLNRDDLRSTTIAYVTLTHRVNKSHVTACSFTNTFISLKTETLAVEINTVADVPWANLFTSYSTVTRI